MLQTARSEWGRDKDEKTLETAKLTFDDPNCLTFVERVEEGEERWHAIGVLDGRTMVTVLHTYRSEGSDEIIRIVSARRADAQERMQYAESF